MSVETLTIDDVREEVRAEQRQKRDAAQRYRSGRISDLLIDHIHIPSGRRAVDGNRAAELAKSIDELGLLSPVIVTRRNGIEVDGDVLDHVPVLVAGAHRMQAMQMLGHTFVRCQEIDADEIDAELIEIGENLHRAELTALQRSEHVARWIELTNTRREAGEVSRQPDAKPGRPEGGVRAAARELGLSEPDARRAVKVAGLSAEAKAAAVDAGLDDNRTALLAAAKEPEPEKQVETIQTRAASPIPGISEDLVARRAERAEAFMEAFRDIEPLLLEIEDAGQDEEDHVFAYDGLTYIQVAERYRPVMAIDLADADGKDGVRAYRRVRDARETLFEIMCATARAAARAA